jgi:hypothetical protein
MFHSMAGVGCQSGAVRPPGGHNCALGCPASQTQPPSTLLLSSLSIFAHTTSSMQQPKHSCTECSCCPAGPTPQAAAASQHTLTPTEQVAALNLAPRCQCHPHSHRAQQACKCKCFPVYPANSTVAAILGHTAQTAHKTGQASCVTAAARCQHTTAACWQEQLLRAACCCRRSLFQGCLRRHGSPHSIKGLTSAPSRAEPPQGLSHGQDRSCAMATPREGLHRLLWSSSRSRGLLQGLVRDAVTR